MAFRDRTNPLFFKSDGGMDLGQVILLSITGYVLAVFVLAGLGVLSITVAAWSFLGSFVVIAFIAWAARDRAELIAKSRAPGDVAQGIAGDRAPGVSIYTADERGDYLDRDYGP